MRGIEGRDAGMPNYIEIVPWRYGKRFLRCHARPVRFSIAEEDVARVIHPAGTQPLIEVQDFLGPGL